ncbi:Zinc finger transcription factor YRR1 [Smittium culicis]|uniref:Zinc finger transcription factor YRR1 n=1 Tax=Smittium culicis TaxID=133412 RepID=A0A1R1XXM3_9FUNG|nr:Zinc finger transcription factor YRR1 [Smittium culicis]
MNSSEGEISDLGQFRTMKRGKTFYSCAVCRDRKVKCDGIRPACSTCIKYDRTCNYKECPVAEEVTKDIESVIKKLARINEAMKKVRILSKYKRINSFPKSPNSCMKLKNCLKELFNLKKKLNKVGRQISLEKKLHKSETANFQIDNCSDKDSTSIDFDEEISKLLSKSALEFGYLDIDDDFIIRIIEKIPMDSLISSILSKNYIIDRLKNNNLPDYMKFSILSVGSKIFEDHSFLNDHLYLCGSTYAEKAFEIISSNLDHPSVDKIFSALLLVIHYDDISNPSRTNFLIDLSTKYAFILRMNIMDTSKKKIPKKSDEWISLEYKRRVWWLLYIRTVINGVNSSTVNKISIRPIFK